jgi:hypothetical protein
VSLPTCRCGAPGVIFRPGTEGGYSATLEIWVERPAPDRAWCLTHAKEAGWPWDVPVQLPLFPGVI